MGAGFDVAQDKSFLVAGMPRACFDEDEAVKFLEEQRWDECPICPRCDSTDVYSMKDKATGGRSARYLWRCLDCKRQFTVRVGTVFEDSRIPLRFWVMAFWLVCASKKGVSALQVKRMTGLTYKSALFMMHRVRLALAEPTPPDGLQGVVEADETYVGGRERGRRGRSHGKKSAVFAMVERGGRVKPIHLKGDKVTGANLKGAILEHVNRSSTLMTDDFKSYKGLKRSFDGGHMVIKHSRGQYVRGLITTNTVEGFFSLLKRGIYGTFHSVSKKHLHRYLSEFEFRYNHRGEDDGDRTRNAIRAAEGKRLTYKDQLENR